MTRDEQRREVLRMAMLDEIERLEFWLHRAQRDLERLKKDVIALAGEREP